MTSTAAFPTPSNSASSPPNSSAVDENSLQILTPPQRTVTFQSPTDIIPFEDFTNIAKHVPPPSVSSSEDEGSESSSSGNGSDESSSPVEGAAAAVAASAAAPLTAERSQILKTSSTTARAISKPTRNNSAPLRNRFLNPAKASRIQRWTQEIGKMQQKALKANAVNVAPSVPAVGGVVAATAALAADDTSTVTPPPAPPPPPLPEVNVDTPVSSVPPETPLSVETLQDQLQVWHQARQARMLQDGDETQGPNGTPKVNDKPLEFPAVVPTIAADDDSKDDDNVPLAMAQPALGNVAVIGDDDDIPLGLVSKKEGTPPPGANISGSTPSDDSVPLANLSRAQAMSKLTGNVVPPQDPDDDDVPLAIVSRMEPKPPSVSSRTASDDNVPLATTATLNKLTGIQEQTEDDDDVPIGLSIQAKVIDSKTRSKSKRKTKSRTKSKTATQNGWIQPPPMPMPMQMQMQMHGTGFVPVPPMQPGFAGSRTPPVTPGSAFINSGVATADDDDVPLAAIAQQTLRMSASRFDI